MEKTNKPGITSGSLKNQMPATKELHNPLVLKHRKF